MGAIFGDRDDWNVDEGGIDDDLDDITTDYYEYGDLDSEDVLDHRRV